MSEQLSNVSNDATTAYNKLGEIIQPAGDHVTEDIVQDYVHTDPVDQPSHDLYSDDLYEAQLSAVNTGRDKFLDREAKIDQIKQELDNELLTSQERSNLHAKLEKLNSKQIRTLDKRQAAVDEFRDRLTEAAKDKVYDTYEYWGGDSYQPKAPPTPTAKAESSDTDTLEPSNSEKLDQIERLGYEIAQAMFDHDRDRVQALRDELAPLMDSYQDANLSPQELKDRFEDAVASSLNGLRRDAAKTAEGSKTDEPVKTEQAGIFDFDKQESVAEKETNDKDERELTPEQRISTLNIQSATHLKQLKEDIIALTLMSRNGEFDDNIERLKARAGAILDEWAERDSRFNRDANWHGFLAGIEEAIKRSEEAENEAKMEAMPPIVKTENEPTELLKKYQKLYKRVFGENTKAAHEKAKVARRHAIMLGGIAVGSMIFPLTTAGAVMAGVLTGVHGRKSLKKIDQHYYPEAKSKPFSKTKKVVINS